MFTPRDFKNETVAFLGEFMGTYLFLFFSFAGAQTVNHAAAAKATPESKNLPTLDDLIFISLIFGMSLTVNVWIFFRISGGMFNPVVTMSLFLVGAFPILRAVVVIAAQMIGGIAAALVVKYMIPGASKVEYTVSLGDKTSVGSGMFLELFFTFELIFTILMLAVEKSKTTFIAPLGIGFALFIAHLGGVFFTGAGLNPARSFASALVSPDPFPSYHWIYWVGPIAGGLLAVGVFKIFKLLHYEQTNGDADQSAYEPSPEMSLEALMGRSRKRASMLMGGAARGARELYGRAGGLYERRVRGKGEGPVLTGTGRGSLGSRRVAGATVTRDPMVNYSPYYMNDRPSPPPRHPPPPPPPPNRPPQLNPRYIPRPSTSDSQRSKRSQQQATRFPVAPNNAVYRNSIASSDTMPAPLKPTKYSPERLVFAKDAYDVEEGGGRWSLTPMDRKGSLRAVEMDNLGGRVVAAEMF